MDKNILTINCRADYALQFSEVQKGMYIFVRTKEIEDILKGVTTASNLRLIAGSDIEITLDESSDPVAEAVSYAVVGSLYEIISVSRSKNKLVLANCIGKYNGELLKHQPLTELHVESGSNGVLGYGPLSNEQQKSCYMYIEKMHKKYNIDNNKSSLKELINILNELKSKHGLVDYSISIENNDAILVRITENCGETTEEISTEQDIWEIQHAVHKYRQKLEAILKKENDRKYAIAVWNSLTKEQKEGIQLLIKEQVRLT